MRRLVAVLVLLVPAFVGHPESVVAQDTPTGGQIQPMCVQGCGGGGVTVEPEGDGTFEVPVNSGPHTLTFLVTNDGSSTGTYTLSCSATGGVACGPVSPAALTLPGGTAGDADVAFTVGTQAGTLTLTATGSATGSGSYVITIATTAAPTVALRNQNGDNWDRGLCLTTGAGEAAVVQCGDLLVAHGTPAYATLGRERSLTLVYTSAQAVPQGVVAATVTLPAGSLTPPTVLAELRVMSAGGSYVTRASASYQGWTPGAQESRQVVLSFSDTSLVSGLYPFQLTVTSQFTTGPLATTVSGTFILVNRAASRFGQGWALAGVEELRFNQPVGASTGDILWIGGDGSAKRYTKLTATKWVGAPGAYQDTLVSSGGTYTRTLRHGIQVVFDAQGRHLRTVARTQQRTAFGWDASGRLATIQVPPVGVAGTTYVIAYDALGKFDRVTDPAGRVTEGSVAAGRLTAMVDPDTTVATTFTYDGAGRLETRTNRRGFMTRYAYANGLRVTRVVLPGSAAGDTTRFQPWDEQGLATGATAQLAVDTATVATRVLGPRVGVADDATIQVDRWGAPIRVTNALNQTTTITRGDPARPALVTRVDFPDGRVGRMTYDARGNLTVTRDSTSHLPNGQPTAVTQWFYNSPNTKDAPSSVVDPEGVTTQYQYNGWGLTSVVTAPNLHRTVFDYVPTGSLAGLLRAVVDSAVPAYDSATGSEIPRHPRVAFRLNTVGNLVGDTSAMGWVRTFVRDSRQLVTDVYDGAGYRTEFTYNQVNLVVQSRAHIELAGVPSIRYPADSGATTYLATTRYARFGLLDSLVDPRGVTRRFTYDGLGRVVTESDRVTPVQRTWYSGAGQVDSVQLRTGGFIRHTYDEGGRLVKTRWDARQSPADSVVYTYDAANRMVTATLGSGRTITRTYFANGLLQSERQGPSTFRHAYTYDRAGKRLAYVVGKPGDITANDSVNYRYSATTGDLQRIRVRWRRPAGLNDPIATDSVRIAWDALGRRDTVAFTNGAIIRFAYDQDGALRVLCSEHAAAISSFALRYSQHNQWVDQAGRIRRVRKTGHTLCPTVGMDVSGPEAAYRYDMRGQMLRDSTDGGGTWDLRYDASGNMVERVRRDRTDSNAYVIGSGTNQISSHYRNGLFKASITHDANGAREQECSHVEYTPPNPWIVPYCVVEAGYREYHYDGLGRTVGTFEWNCVAIDENGWTCGAWTGNGATYDQCAYDPIGRLGRGCTGWEVGYDGQNVSRTVNDSAGFGWTFIHGPGTDDPLLGFSPAGSGTHAYFITDGGGRLYAVGTPDGQDLRAGGLAPSVQQQAFQYWGGDYSGGATASAGFGADRFATDAQVGLSFFRNRIYDQATGRWTQEDPIGLAGGVNLYQFNGNSPAMYADPFGLCPEHMKARAADCQKWNQEQVEKARQLIARHAETEGVLVLPEDLPVIGVNAEDIAAGCPSRSHEVGTDRGCSALDGSWIKVDVDRELPNVAATVQHELVHQQDPRGAISNPLGPSGEDCAVATEQWTTVVFGGRPDSKTPMGAPNPRRTCR